MAKTNKWEVGKKLYHTVREGVYEYIGAQGAHHMLYDADEGLAFLAPDEVLEEVASDLYKIGDQVKSKLFFKGEVTAFEPGTNRVVCVSRAHEGCTLEDRRRYAYRVDEIVLKEDEYFEEGEVYTILRRSTKNPRIDVRAVQHPGRCDKFMLLNNATGELEYTVRKDIVGSIVCNRLNINAIMPKGSRVQA